MREELGACRMGLDAAEAKLKVAEGERERARQESAGLLEQAECDRGRISELERSLGEHGAVREERDALIVSEAGLKESLDRALGERGELKRSLEETLAMLQGLEEELAGREAAARGMESELAARSMALAEQESVSEGLRVSLVDACDKSKVEKMRREEAEKTAASERRAREEAEVRVNDLEAHVVVERANAASLSKTIERAELDTRHYAGRAAEESAALEREREEHREEVRLLTGKVGSTPFPVLLTFPPRPMSAAQEESLYASSLHAQHTRVKKCTHAYIYPRIDFRQTPPRSS